MVFTKTRILTVKVATLTTFLAMVKTLDQVSISSVPIYTMLITISLDESHTEACAASVQDTY